MPEWYHAYVDAAGQPAGDYLGTISQMDAQIGRLRAMLRQYNVANNTVSRMRQHPRALTITISSLYHRHQRTLHAGLQPTHTRLHTLTLAGCKRESRHGSQPSCKVPLCLARRSSFIASAFLCVCLPGLPAFFVFVRGTHAGVVVHSR